MPLSEQEIGERCVLRSDAPLLGRLARTIFRAADLAAPEHGRTLAEELLRLGLTCEELADLELREPLISEILEYAGASGGGVDGLMKAVNAVMQWHTQDINREIQMLLLRRRALERKRRALLRLTYLLAEEQTVRPSI